jgi:uncharacterized protein (TIGR00106 family)
MTLMDFAIIPLDKGDSFSKYVAEVLDIVDNSGLDYQLTPMGTIVEGEWSDLLALLDRCFKAIARISARISLTVKFDHRKGRKGRLLSKIKSVQEKLGRDLKTGL